MLSFSSRNIFSLLCAGAVLSLVGCGGSSSDGGLAPSSLAGYILQVNPESSDGDASIGPLNIAGGSGTGTVGYVNAGTEYSAGVQTVYSKTGPNSARITCTAITPDNPENPTTESIKFQGSINFISRTNNGWISGELEDWTYTSYTAGKMEEGDDGVAKLASTEIRGSSGVAKLIPIQ
jgi:hypothetical protein